MQRKWSLELESSENIDFEKEWFQRQDVAATNKDGRFKEGQWGTVQSHLWGSCGSDCEGIVKGDEHVFHKHFCRIMRMLMM